MKSLGNLSFTTFVGHKDAKLAVILNFIDPSIGGAIFVGEKGAGKSTLARLSQNLRPEGVPFVEGPLNLTADGLLGGVDFEKALRTGEKRFSPGIFSRAHGGVLFLDDVNLLSPEILNLILETQDRGENLVSREGLSYHHAASFSLLATMNPEEGQLSAHVLDRFGLWVSFPAIHETARRIQIIKYNLSGWAVNLQVKSRDALLAKKVQQSREALLHLEIDAEVLEYISQICLAGHVAGHRADLVLKRAARAYAAFRGDKGVAYRHVEKVVPLVLAHRLRRPPQPPEAQQSPETSQREPEQQENRNHTQNQGDQPPPTSSPFEDSAKDEFPWLPGLQAPDEKVFDVGEVFSPRRLVLRRDRLERLTSGRRTTTRYAGKGGKYLKSTLRKKQNDLAVDATLRAAAPWQVLRGRQQQVLIHPEDLRFKQRERKMGHLVLFVLDCSGSMGARQRMIATKGAVMSLLLDCYQKRDKVSMIIFRKHQAEVVLPPTQSVELASRRLQELPVGGKTPLNAALLAAHSLLSQVSRKEPQRRFLVIIISDGRANEKLSDQPVQVEMEKLARLLLEFSQADFLVIDTEDKSNLLRADLAKRLAILLGADYYTSDNLRSDYLAGMVQQRLAPEASGPN